MFGGNDMSKMMKQLGMDMEEIDADRVTVEIGGKTLVFENPELSKIEAQGKEIFQLQGEYSEQESGPDDEDVELVMEKADCSCEEAVEALQEHGDIAEAVMSLE